MSSEELRRAAALMRERAEAATPGPWHSLGQWLAHDVEGCTCGAGVGAMPHEGGCGIEQIATLAAPDAKYVASMHPAVALSVADWLDGVALFVEAKDDEEYFDLDGDPIAPEDTHAIGSALDVARIYLRTAS